MSNSKKVPLPTPIKRGDVEIKEVQLYEPSVQALQNLEITAVIRGDVSQMVMLLPRISDLSEQEVKSLNFKNMAALSLSVTSFLGD